MRRVANPEPSTNGEKVLHDWNLQETPESSCLRCSTKNSKVKQVQCPWMDKKKKSMFKHSQVSYDFRGPHWWEKMLSEMWKFFFYEEGPSGATHSGKMAVRKWKPFLCYNPLQQYGVNEAVVFWKCASWECRRPILFNQAVSSIRCESVKAKRVALKMAPNRWNKGLKGNKCLSSVVKIKTKSAAEVAFEKALLKKSSFIYQA